MSKVVNPNFKAVLQEVLSQLRDNPIGALRNKVE
jgi:hypothetical protein